MTQTEAGKLADECERIAAFPIEQMPVYRAQGVLKQAAAALRALRTPPTGNAMREALKTAIQHIEHMAAWITEANREYHPIPGAYSFEGLGEDLPGIKAALEQREDVQPVAWPDDPGQLASSLVVAWSTYLRAFGEQPHGTLKQMRALLRLMPPLPPLPDSAGAGGVEREALTLALEVLQTVRRVYIENPKAPTSPLLDMTIAKIEVALSPRSGKSDGREPPSTES